MNNIVDISKNVNQVYFYFTKKSTEFFNSNKPDSTNFAKSNSTFCGNLLDLMKYQEDVLKNNKCDS